MLAHIFGLALALFGRMAGSRLFAFDRANEKEIATKMRFVTSNSKPTDLAVSRVL